MQDQGHALAQVDPPVVDGYRAARVLDVSYAVAAGPRVNLGPISIDGLHDTDMDFALQRLGLVQGEPYSPARLAQARADLLSSGLFNTVRTQPATALDTQGELPVVVNVTERSLHVITLGAAWSSDQGGNLTAGWTDRNLFGRGEQLTLGAAVTQLGGSADRAPGYRLGGTLKLPDWQARDQSLTFNLVALHEYLDTYNRTGVTGGATLARVLLPHLTASAGVQAVSEAVNQEGMQDTYHFLQAPLGLTWDSANSKLDPTAGLRAGLVLMPTASFGTAGQAYFTMEQVSAAVYQDLTGDGRSVLAARALVGVMQGASVFAIPPDQRFYAGGSNSVRGFRYQSIGPEFPGGNPTGGTATDTVGIELRQRFGESWGAVLFSDAGQVSASGSPFNGGVAVGAGVGVRYYTPIGPVRLDVAVPVHVPAGQHKPDAVEFYLGLGQAF